MPAAQDLHNSAEVSYNGFRSITVCAAAQICSRANCFYGHLSSYLARLQLCLPNCCCNKRRLRRRLSWQQGGVNVGEKKPTAFSLRGRPSATSPQCLLSSQPPRTELLMPPRLLCPLREETVVMPPLSSHPWKTLRDQVLAAEQLAASSRNDALVSILALPEEMP
jgi:hypothetical protein